MSISDFANSAEGNKTTWDENNTAAPDTSATASSAESTTTDTPTLSDTPAPVGTDEILQGLMSRITPIGQKANFKILVYGDPGTTKSSFVATAPNNLIIDLEDGLMSAKNSPTGIAPNVGAYPWNGFDGFAKLVGKFMENPPELEPYKILSIDSLSELHKRALAEVTEREWRKRPSSNRYVAETEHHVENNERVTRIIRALRDLNRDLIVTAHAKTVEPKNKPAKTYADFSESLSNKIMGMMDIVGYMFMKDVEGVPTPHMRVVTDGTIHCKTRLPLPAEIPNPTYAMLRKVWEENKNN